MRAIRTLFLLVAGCGAGSGSTPDSALPARDAAADSAAPTVDGAPLLGTNTAILGTLTGVCPSLTGMLSAPTPSLIENSVTFAGGESYARAELSPGGQRIFDTPNAGGSSTESEVMAFEVLHFCDGATLVKTETEVLYAPPDDAGASSITDILVGFGATKIGVSVTRVYKPTVGGMTDLEARDLLVRKLDGINRSSQRVLAADRWQKQILHVFVATEAAAAQVPRVLATIDSATRADTIVVVTRTVGGGFVYCNPDPPLGTECPVI